ncbi:hypothetical protein KUV80_11540 [Fictibacillus nanhaiensis]|uniref:Ig-like domain-containing protein n=1 Tax=Fictibacillus nanhaiensis TaxID=742169 RepID=UPI001C940663|nr:Ig-like domain-containing protein [Fictibacillus nanhaiensis]MBY6037294.1 hypothetical protein [Fictibacillus nanhaiensis]
MKRKLSLLFLLVTLVVGSFPLTSFANEDFPRYESLSVSPKEAAINEPVLFDLYAPDSAYFMLEARLTYKSPQGETQEIVLNGPDHWTGKFTASSFDEVGTWELQSIYLYDDSYNSSLFTRENIEQPEKYDFTILNEIKEADVTAPSVNAITFEKEQVQAGDFTKITVSASDDTGVEWVTLGLYNTSGRGSGQVTDFVKTENGTFEATWWVPQFTDQGEWQVSWIYAGDAAGNQSYWDAFAEENYPEAFGKIQVLNKNPDYTAPTVSTIQFVNESVQAGQENTIIMEAEDDLSGINYVSVGLKNTLGQTLFIHGIYKNENGLWTGSVLVPSYMKHATFKVWNVYVEDVAGNVDHQFYEEEYPPEFGTFEVINDNEDVSAPEVHSATFDKEIMTSGGTNVVRVNATDDNSGIENIEIYLKSPSGKGTTSTYLYLNEEGSWIGEFHVPPYTESGEWRVEKIIGRDFAGNTADITYSAENYPETFGTFIVENENFDQTAPKVNKVVFQKSEVKANEEAALTVYGEDAETVPAFVEVKLVSPSGKQSLMGNSDYLDESGLMHITIPVSEDAEHGEWLIQQIRMVDLAGNEAVYAYAAEDYPATFGKLFINNDRTAPAAPEVDEVSDSSNLIQGTAEPMAAIVAYVNGEVLAEGNTTETGTFSIEIPAQTAGTLIEVLAVDEAGNKSEKTRVTVVDRTAPERPIVTEVTKVSVSGTTEPSAFVTIVDSKGMVLASVHADENGHFHSEIQKQKNHDFILVSAADLAGNASGKQQVFIKHKK